MANCGWKTFTSGDDLAKKNNLKFLKLMNDFEAIGYGVPNAPENTFISMTPLI